MPSKSIRTPRWITPSPQGKTSRLHIPQPIERPLNIHGKTVIKTGALKNEPWWFSQHKRGIFRPLEGLDPLEQRAVSKETMNGTLPERMVYLYLVSKLRLSPGIDFDFQSSLEGGRLELGGIVADFLFENQRIVLQIQGPTHNTFLRKAKDEEQYNDLARYGYQVFELWEYEIYDPYLFEERMRRIFALPNGIAGSGGAYGAYEGDPLWYEGFYTRLQTVYNFLMDFTGIS